jgi:hypothetical protein
LEFIGVPAALTLMVTVSRCSVFFAFPPLNLIHHVPLGSVPVYQRSFIGVVHIFRIVGSENIQKVTSCPLNFLSVSTICFAVRYPFLPAKDLLENLKPGLTKAKTTLGGPLIVAHQAKVMFCLFPAQFGVRASTRRIH